MTRARVGGFVALVAGALALLAWSQAEAGGEADKASEKYPGLAGGPLRAGLDPPLPPVMYRDPKDPAKIVGQDPDMVDAAMKCLGLKYELVALDFGTLVPTLQADQIQLVWSNIYYTPERAKVADFVTYATTGTAGIVRKGNPKKILSVADTCGKRAAPILGTVEEKAFRDQSEKCFAAGKPSIEITTYPNAPATTRAIQNDRADLSMYDLVLVDEVVRQNRDTLERAFAFNTGIKIGVAVKKGNEELVSVVREALEALQRSEERRVGKECRSRWSPYH